MYNCRTTFYSLIVASCILFVSAKLQAQEFIKGADLSYVNEMEDCGVVYKDNNIEKDPYKVFAEYGCNLVRLRLWHSPAWYDNLNDGKRYSDLTDVIKSSKRAKEQGMQILLDFHLSDNWADPSKQLVPAAWLDVVDDLELLQDSLYNHIYYTLNRLHQEDALPEIVQIGNETNRGILLNPVDNQSWTLDWDRNIALFNTAIDAVRDIEANLNKEIKVAIHVAGPDDTMWLVNSFMDKGISEIDMIGISYYWQWHQPSTIADVGVIVEELKSLYPDKEVVIFEAGLHWSLTNNDAANNILNTSPPGFPIGVITQRTWLESLSETVLANGGSGVIYWEPAWVSSDCSTQWGKGSHYENACFFDFDNNVLVNGGMRWYENSYVQTDDYTTEETNIKSKILNERYLLLELDSSKKRTDLQVQLYSINGTMILDSIWPKTQDKLSIDLQEIQENLVIIHVSDGQKTLWSEKKYTGKQN